MARFFTDNRAPFQVESPTQGLGPTAGQTRVKQATPEKAEKKKEIEPDREKQAQEPIRKTEGGRYDGADGYSDLF
jgi:hypothetical protein